jgi:hypothetical protein
MEQAQRASGDDAGRQAICSLLTSEYRNEIEIADQLLWECDSLPPPLEIDRIDGAISLLYSVTKIWGQLKSAMCELGGAEGVRDAFVFILVEIVADMLWRVASNTILDSDRATAVIRRPCGSLAKSLLSFVSACLSCRPRVTHGSVCRPS